MGIFLSNNIEKAKESFFDILFPKFCVGCGREGRYVCDNCSLFLAESLPSCPVCSKYSFGGEAHLSCQKEFSLKGLTSLWEYEGLAKHLIYQAKTKGNFHIFREAIEEFFKALIADPKRFSPLLSFLDSQEVCISYVPLPKKKQKSRGFNQAEVIAKETKRFLKIDTIPLLRKVRETKPQAGLDRKERIANVRNSFQCEQYHREIKRVLLVDDFFSSGATLKECCRTLKDAGIKEVWGLTVAKIT